MILGDLEHVKPPKQKALSFNIYHLLLSFQKSAALVTAVYFLILI